ncbi:MAG: Asp23/Gls24 family envelope stress response protein [Desulfotomaculaceae bacterium]|nr:Asp23/Gls24 family envelope stress response protein [Desulfotomaculaceae bacterium]
MEVYALVGPSGTGKSHRAVNLAHQIDAQAIIDDGLLIQGNRILAGSSAKRQPTRISAIRSALFMDDRHAEIMKESLGKLDLNRLLLLGTSVGMVERIASRLGLPIPCRIIRIEEVASEKEIRKAKYLRTCYSKHVIPAPTLEVKKSFPNTLVDPLKVFMRKKGSATGRKDWLEQSMVRPTFTYNGRLTIANSALSAIAGHAATSVKGVKSAGKIGVIVEHDGFVTVDVSPVILFGLNLQEVAIQIQQKIKQSVEDMTGLQVKSVNIQVKGLSFDHISTEATS